MISVRGFMACGDVRKEIRRRAFGIGVLAISMLCLVSAVSTVEAQSKRIWRAASPAELEAHLPARATVEKERIETEMRTATGIIDDHDNVIAAVVLVTAGYSADGKYSHFLLAQRPIRIGGELRLASGSYVWVGLAGRMGYWYASSMQQPVSRRVRSSPIRYLRCSESNPSASTRRENGRLSR